MRPFSRKVALLLLPALVRGLVLPNEIPTVESSTATSRSAFDDASNRDIPTFFDYDFDDQSLRFAIPCPDCSDEEKKALEQQIISVKPRAENTKHCTSTDPIGLEINGKQIISTGESNLSLQSHVGPSELIDFSKHPIFNQTRWINTCGCTKPGLDDEDCADDFESTFSLEFLGLPSGRKPGFTLSYQQYGQPQLLRLSPIPDTEIVTSRQYGQSSHFRSPRLRLQKAIKSTSSSILSSPSNSPSTTVSAYSPSYTFFEKNPSVLEVAPQPPTTTPSPVSYSRQQAAISSEKSEPAIVEEQIAQTGWNRKALAALSHGTELVKMTAKSGSQKVLQKVDDLIHPKLAYTVNSNSKQGQSPLTEDNLDAHDELDDGDLYQLSSISNIDEDNESQNTFLELDQSTSSWFLDDPTAIKAFQISSLVIIVVALSGSIFALVRRNPRLRAKWATVIEERRTQRLYRRAACKQRFYNFFARSRTEICREKTPVPETDSDDALDWHDWEKRFSTDSTLPGGSKQASLLSQDLLAFRKAHQFVDGIVSAEEGRSQEPQYHLGRRFGRHRRARAVSVSSEKTAPPAYESENDDIVLDADCPRYVFMRRGAPGSTPGSSVIATSPRTSCADSDSEHDEKF